MVRSGGQIGGLPIALINRATSAGLMLDAALRRRGSTLPPLIFTSANGQVLSMSARHAVRKLFLDADLIHADGMPLVLVSRLFHKRPLPERVCTTDLFHDVARVAPPRGARMFLLGATKEVIDEAARRIRRLYPELQLAGHASGYMRRAHDEERVIELINAPGPTFCGSGLAYPPSRLSPYGTATGCASDRSKPRAVCSTTFPARTLAHRPDACSASNGLFAPTLSRGVSSAAISRPILTLCFCCSPAQRVAREATRHPTN